MAFKDLHKLKKISVIEKETIQVPYLVVGKDVFALSKYQELIEIHGKENVRLLSQDPILKSDIFPKGPSTIRGEENQKLFKELYKDVEVEEIGESALFYKDMTWKSFGGRSKSEALKYDEEFFTGGRVNVELASIFPKVNLDDAFFEAINEEAYQVKIKTIARIDGIIVVECINGTEFLAENVYFALSPYQYLDFYKNKNELSDSFIQFCETTKTSSALFVKFLFEKKVLSELKETLFIPLSYTHEWGHFIGEFKTNNDSQEIEFIHYMEDHLMSEEDVSRVIRLLKKSMEKIFPDFNKFKSQEYIALEQDLACLKIDDELFEKSLAEGKREMERLLFIGINAPLAKVQRVEQCFEYSFTSINGMTRGLSVLLNS